MLHKFKKSKLQFPTFILGEFWVILKSTKLPKLSTGLVGCLAIQIWNCFCTHLFLSLRLSNIIWKWLESKSTVVSPAPPGWLGWLILYPVSWKSWKVVCNCGPEQFLLFSFLFLSFTFFANLTLYFIQFNKNDDNTLLRKRAYRTINNDNIIMLFKFSFTST